MVAGAGSVWSNTDSFFVGSAGAGNQLVVSNGAALFINNNGQAVSIRNLQSSSSREIKQSITELSDEEALTLLQGLRTVTFEFTDDDSHTSQVGFIAEETPDLLTSADKKAIKPFGVIALFSIGNEPSYEPECTEVLSIIAAQVSMAIKRKQAEATPDRKQRIALLQQAEKVMIEEAPIIPLYVYTQKNLAKPYVKGIRRNIGAQVPLQRVWIDPDWRSGK